MKSLWPVAAFIALFSNTYANDAIKDKEYENYIQGKTERTICRSAGHGSYSTNGPASSPSLFVWDIIRESEKKNPTNIGMLTLYYFKDLKSWSNWDEGDGLTPKFFLKPIKFKFNQSEVFGVHGPYYFFQGFLPDQNDRGNLELVSIRMNHQELEGYSNLREYKSSQSGTRGISTSEGLFKCYR